ncbi:MAG: signal recognition particle-docking protein FtsY [Clostridiales bacterium]|nr:signal recognition particle-docking protein FtsY [Clostridiales bacterium]
MDKNEGFFRKLISGLSKTRDSISSRIGQVLNLSGSISDDLYDEIEEILITSDIGIKSTEEITSRLREKVRTDKIKDPAEIKNALKEILTDMLQENDRDDRNLKLPMVVLVVGVNGVGKTTTIGKLAKKYKDAGMSVLIAAADTFRAAAIDQICIWGSRVGADVIRQHEGSDPAAVVYDAVQSAKARKTDVLICDTAGRLHNKKNLMDELKKINRVIDREYADSYKETLLVLDATTGQNAVIQAREFKDACDVSGIALTKLDGTAKGGIIIAIKNELGIPVKYIGVGEGIDDLQEFDSRNFVNALFGD